jgi:hypothetical protein
MATSQTTVTVVNFALHLRYRDPRTDAFFDLPAGPIVHATAGTKSLINAAVAAAGRVTLNVPVKGNAKIALEIDFSGREYLDLAAKAFVAESARATNDTKPLIRMPARWQSKRQKTFIDDLGGRFKTGEVTGPTTDQQGTAAAPWVIQIDHAWDRVFVQFDFYDVDAKALAAVTQGLLVEAFRTADMKSADRVGAGSVLTDDGMVCLAIHTRTDRKQLRIKLSTAADSFLDLRQHRAVDRMKVIAAATFNALPGTGKRALYALPELWTSPNQHARLGPSVDDVSKLISQNTSAIARLRFDLDDTMLVSEAGLPVAVPASPPARIALFDHVLAIRNPDAAQPYLSTDTIKGNFIPADLIRVNGQDARQTIRVIRFGSTFYDLLQRRTTKGPRIGARAAQRNDHPHQRINSPYGLAPPTGLFDLHYFHDCWIDKGGQPLAHVLVYWSARFRKGAASQNPHPAPGAPNPFVTPTQAEIDSFNLAMKTASIRHEGWHPSEPTRPLAQHKHYFFKPVVATSTPNRTIKPAFHFASFKNNEAICQIAVRSFFRSSTGQTTATYEVSDRAPLPPPVPPNPNSVANPVPDVDNISYVWFTMPHENGHSLGLDDEYTEGMDVPAWTAANLRHFEFPVFVQWGNRHMRWDKNSLMNNNRAPRLRHYWHYARWVNGNAAVQALLGGVRYEIHYQATGITPTKTFRYHLPAIHDNFNNPAHSQNNFTLGTHGRMNLALFRVGEDEMTLVPGKMLPTATAADGFDAILNVTINLNYSYVGAGWTPQLQHRLLRRMEDLMIQLRGGTQWHTLDDPGAPSFKKVLVYIQTRYDIAAGNGRHFRLNARVSTAAPPPTSSLVNPVTTSATINILDTDPASPLLRYCLGLGFVTVTPPAAPGGAATTTLISGIAAGDLAPLAAWVKTQRDAATDNLNASGTPIHVHAYTHHRHP